MAQLVRAATDRNPPTLGGRGCQNSHPSFSVVLRFPFNPFQSLEKFNMA